MLIASYFHSNFVATTATQQLDYMPKAGKFFRENSSKNFIRLRHQMELWASPQPVLLRQAFNNNSDGHKVNNGTENTEDENWNMDKL